MTNIILNDEAWEDVEDGTEGLLDEWLVSEGEAVTKGQVIASVVLVKATHEITAPAAGSMQSIEVAAEDNFTRGQTLAVIT